MTMDEDAPETSAESRQLTAARLAVFLTAVTQILVIPGFLFPFVTTRNVFFRLCVELALSCVLIAGVKRLRELEGRADPILKGFCLFMLALSLAALFGLSPWHSLFGDFERMNGVWAWLHLFLFYLVLRILMREEDWPVLFRIIVVVADLIVIWGASEFLPTAMRNPRFQLVLSAGSTIGNPGLLAPYLLLCLALNGWLLGTERRWGWKALAVTSELILLVGIGGARNRSSQLGLVFGSMIGLAVFLFLQPDRRRLLKKYSLPALVTLALLIGGAYALSLKAPSIADQFWGRWNGFLASPVDHIRTLEWKIGADGFRERPILGYGPENHQIIVSHHFDPAVYSLAGGGIFDRTHNAWIELLATSGLVGFLAMVGVWLAAVATLRDGVREKSLASWEAGLLVGALTGYAVYLTFWFFDVNSAIVWVVLLAFLGSRVRGRIDVLNGKEANPGALPARPLRRITTWAAVVLIALAAYLHGIVPLVAAHDLSVAASGGSFADRLNRFERVMNSAAPQTLHTLPLYYSYLRSTSRYANAADADPLLRKRFNLALQRGMIEAKRSISRNPEDDRSYFDAARFSMLAGSFYRDARYVLLARNELLHAIRISPRRPDSRVVLSSVYLTLRDSSKARAQLDSAMRLAPQYGGSFFFAARDALQDNDPDSAAVLLRLSLKNNFQGSDSVFFSTVSALERRGEYLPAAELGQAYLESKVGPMAEWKWQKSSSRVSLTPLSDSLADKLPILYLKSGNTAAAISVAIAFGAVKRGIQPIVTAFVNDVRSGATSRWTDKSSLVPLIVPKTASSSTPGVK